MSKGALGLVAMWPVGLAAQRVSGAELLQARPVPSRIIEAIDNDRRTVLVGNVHPLAKSAFDQGAVEDSLPLERMVLVLARSDEQQARLAALNEEQLDPGSPLFTNGCTRSRLASSSGRRTTSSRK